MTVEAATTAVETKLVAVDLPEEETEDEEAIFLLFVYMFVFKIIIIINILYLVSFKKIFIIFFFK